MAGRGDIEAGRAFVKLYTKDAGLLSGLKAGLGTVAKGIGAAAVGIGALGGVAAAGIGAALTHFASLGSELNDMSASTGVAAGSLAELKFAAEQSGAGLEDVEIALKKFVKGGHDVKQFDQMAASIAAIKDPSERARKAMEMFGKGGTKLLPMFAELKSLRNEAQSLGLAPSDEDVAMADALGDSFDKIKSVMGAAMFKIGAAFAPIIQPMLEGAAKLIGMFNKWALENNIVIDTLKSIGDAISGGDWALAGEIAIKGLQLAVATGVNFIADMIGGTLGDSFGQVGAMILGGDFYGAWNSAVAGMAKLWADFSSGVVMVFSAAANSVTQKWKETVNSLATGMLKTAAGGGVMGKIMSKILGVDVAAAVAENDRLDRARGISQDALGIGTAGISDSTNAAIDPIAAKIKTFLDGMQVAADTAASDAESGAKNAMGGNANRANIGRLMDELNDLRSGAATAKASQRKKAGPAGDVEDIATKVSNATASSAGAALALSGAGNSTALGVAKQSYAELKEIRKAISVKQKIVINAV